MSFNPELVRTEDGRELLAQEIAEFLDRDNSEPVPHRDDWTGEKALRDLESIVLQKYQLYQAFADVCDRAHNLAKNASVRALLQLGQINGLRRLPETKRPDELLGALFEEAWNSINGLADSSWKARLASLWFYNTGIYARVTGDYALAFTAQERSADLAETVGDKKTALLSRFCTMVERINLALVENLDSENIGALLTEMCRVGKQLDNALKGMTEDPTAVRWFYFNVPLHRLVSHFWAGRQYDDWADAYPRLFEGRVYDQEFFDANQSSVEVALAISSWNTGRLENAVICATNVIQGHLGSPPSPEYVATAHLILAKVAIARSENAEQHFRAASTIEGSAHQVRAIARRALGQSDPSA